MMLSFWTDAIVAVLLVATIGYSMLLNRRLTAIRQDRDKFEDVIKNLATASQRAETAVANLRSTADDLGRRLDKRIEEGRALSDDLIYMIERGGKIADTLAASIRSGRDRLKSEVEPDSRLAFLPEAKAEVRQEHRVEPVARPVPRQDTARPTAIRREPMPVEPRLASVPAARAGAQEQDRTGATSRAERELVRALARRR